MREERHKMFIGEGVEDGKSLLIGERYDTETNSFVARIHIGASSFECSVSELWQIVEWLKELIGDDCEEYSPL